MIVFFTNKLKEKVALISLFSLFLCIYHITACQETNATETRNTNISVALDPSNGHLSLDVQNATLSDVLTKVSQKTSVPIHAFAPLQHRVSITIQDAALPSVLDRLVPNWAMTKKEGDSTNPLAKAYVVSDGQNLLPPNPRKANLHQTKKSSFKTAPHPEPEKLNPPSFKDSILPAKKSITSHRPRYVPHQLSVRFRAEISEQERQHIVDSLNARIDQQIESLDLVLLRLPQTITVDEALNRLQDNDALLYSEPNRLIPLQYFPNDQDFPQQWALNNTGQSGGLVDADIDATEAWDLEIGSEDVIIAVVDTGVDYKHIDLSENIWNNSDELPGNGIDDDENGFIDDTRGWDFVDATSCTSDEDCEDPDNDPMDRHGHGTHIASVIGALQDNNIGISGISPNCQVMALRAGYKDASGDGLLESVDAAEAIIYAADNSAQIINLSWGDAFYSSLIADAVAYATDKGALVCTAAGNSNSEQKIYPAGLGDPAVIAVGATNRFDQKAAFSNYGQWVEVFAPGESIYGLQPRDGYGYQSGTSMATPFASAVAALVKSANPMFSALETKAQVLRGVDVLTALEGKNLTSGRLNAYNALSTEYTSPHIFSISPAAAHVGDKITIFGHQFGHAMEEGIGEVIFTPDISADIENWEDQQIDCIIPSNAQSGPLKIETASGEPSNEMPITVLSSYYTESTIENEYSGNGQPQGWQADDAVWQYDLPFEFPFYGRKYQSVYICSNGYIDFTDSNASYQNSLDAFENRVMMAPLWTDLLTNCEAQPGEDIYIEHSEGSVSINWVAESYDSEKPINFGIVLKQSGKIIFRYGDGIDGVASTIGISAGNGRAFLIPTAYDSETLHENHSLEFKPIIHSFNLSLDNGWNLISLPVLPNNPGIEKVLGEAAAGIDIVWRYGIGEWQMFMPQFTSGSTLKSMKPGDGYWIKTSKANVDIELNGQGCPYLPKLKSGWNLVGFNWLQPTPIDQMIGSFDKNIESIWEYSERGWRYDFVEHSGISSLQTVRPGKGYWVKLKKNNKIARRY